MKSESKLSDIAFSFTIDLNFTLISLKEFCGEIEKYLKNSDELLLKEEHRPELRNLWELVKEKELKFNVEIVDNLNEETLSKEELLLNKLLESSIYSMKVIPFYRMSVVYSFALLKVF
ncbi:MAG: hypothetical protein H7645_01260 [Candidatus Heimdallarchaeota archaeon]|nr:hypothetical protein [Candidatus Heimdallarchaeota archaeon]MCK4768944.1 hypothetical protein [Candidatus Heimdallarchaeota archaeon]